MQRWAMGIVFLLASLLPAPSYAQTIEEPPLVVEQGEVPGTVVVGGTWDMIVQVAVSGSGERSVQLRVNVSGPAEILSGVAAAGSCSAQGSLSCTLLVTPGRPAVVAVQARLQPNSPVGGSVRVQSTASDDQSNVAASSASTLRIAETPRAVPTSAPRSTAVPTAPAAIVRPAPNDQPAQAAPAATAAPPRPTAPPRQARPTAAPEPPAPSAVPAFDPAQNLVPLDPVQDLLGSVGGFAPNTPDVAVESAAPAADPQAAAPAAPVAAAVAPVAPAAEAMPAAPAQPDAAPVAAQPAAAEPATEAVVTAAPRINPATAAAQLPNTSAIAPVIIVMITLFALALGLRGARRSWRAGRAIGADLTANELDITLHRVRALQRVTRRSVERMQNRSEEMEASLRR